MASSELDTTATLLRGILERQAAADAAGRAPGLPGAQGEEEPPSGSAGIELALDALDAIPGIKGAAVADASGLTVGARGGAIAPERMAAYSVALGAVLDSAGRLLGAEGRDRAAVRLQGDDEAILHRFVASARTYHLIVVRDVRAGAPPDLARAVAALGAALTDRRTRP